MMGKRERERERERDRDRDRERRRHRSRSRDRERESERARSRDRDRSRSRDRDRNRRRRSPSVEITSVSDRELSSITRAALLAKQKRPPLPAISYSTGASSEAHLTLKVDNKEPEEQPVLTPEEEEMQRIMGFTTFDSTKGKKVEGNDLSGVHVVLKRKYRQYMNRKGGFNRPLDFVA